MLRSILLDIDNTLLDFNQCSLQALRETFAAFSMPFRTEQLADFMAVNDRLWREVERQALTREGVHRLRFFWLLDRLGLEGDAAAMETLYGRLLSESHIPVEGAPELVAYLAERYTLYIASNSSYARQSHRLELAGLLPYFKALFVSEEIGAPKPSRAFFDACMERMGRPDKSEVLLLGDSLTADMAGGVEYGIQTCWYNHNGLPRPEGLAVTYTVDRLAQVRDIL